MSILQVDQRDLSLSSLTSKNIRALSFLLLTLRFLSPKYKYSTLLGCRNSQKNEIVTFP